VNEILQVTLLCVGQLFTLNLKVSFKMHVLDKPEGTQSAHSYTKPERHYCIRNKLL